ncbi:MAG: cytidine deaminase [Candidatus Heimdallarchaeota archaeon]
MESEELSEAEIKRLLQKAIEVRDKAYSLTGIRVGAALLGRDSTIYTGCNIENDVTNLGICAERVAVFKAVAKGEQEFKAIAVVSNQDIVFPPCGACRQVLWQFVKGKHKDLLVIIGDKHGSYDPRNIKKLSELLPLAFSLKSETTNQ